jgi:hypothetical protein
MCEAALALSLLSRVFEGCGRHPSYDQQLQEHLHSFQEDHDDDRSEFDSSEHKQELVHTSSGDSIVSARKDIGIPPSVFKMTLGICLSAQSSSAISRFLDLIKDSGVELLEAEKSTLYDLAVWGYAQCSDTQSAFNSLLEMKERGMAPR